MRFLLDMNLPPAIADRLRAEAHDAIHVADAGFGSLSDRDIFTRAAEDSRIVVTFDLDFGEISGAADHPKTGVILLRLRRAHQSYLWDRLASRNRRGGRCSGSRRHCVGRGCPYPCKTSAAGGIST